MKASDRLTGESKMNNLNSIRMAAVAIAMTFSAFVAAAPLPVMAAGGAHAVPSALPLARFYPAQLPSSPAGIVEEPQVWLAKVQGLVAAAPSVLQQSLLASQTAQDFASNVALLQQMQEGMLKQGALDMKSQVRSGAMASRALGDASNLVYKPLEPCRIMDTRNATAGSGVQGPITGGSLKQIPGFITAGSNWSIYGQTGTLSDCGLTNPPGTFIHGVAIVITILNPNFDAFLGVSDINSLSTTLSTVALNYTHGQGLSTMYIVPQIATNIIYFALPAGLSAHIIFDVVGYFVVSDATALQCTTQASAPVAVGIASSGTAISPACTTGYTLTGGSCDSSSTSMTLVSHEASGTNTTWTCVAFNAGGSSANLTATANCCRVPGK
jgi:hypothetical protein